MSVLRLLFLTLSVIAAFAVVKFAISVPTSIREHQSVTQLSAMAQATTDWTNGTVALSLERSVTQVALALDEPAPPAFLQLIDEQRAKSDELLSRAETAIASFDDLATRDAFLSSATDARATVARLRSEVDQLLRIPATQRDAGRSNELPYELKAVISELKGESELLRIPNNVSSTEAEVLYALQNRAWEVREFGGRARTYYAIATLTERPISPGNQVVVASDSRRADDAWRAIQSMARTVELSPALAARIEAADEHYYGTYLPVLARIDAAFADSPEDQRVSLPIVFADFFELSNEALGHMSGLSEAAGTELLAYWRDRTEVAALALATNIGMLGFVVAIVIAAMFVVRARVVRPLTTFTAAVERLAAGDVIEVPGRERRDEIGALARAMDAINDRGLEAARIRVALDSSSAMIMLADTGGKIVFVNQSLHDLLAANEAAIRKESPTFHAGSLIGSPIDAFRTQAVEQEQGGFRLTLAGREFVLSISPVRDRHGARLGEVAEWRDMTAELRATAEIDAVVSAALQGDLSRRADVADAPEVLRRMGERLNAVAAAVDASVSETNRVVRALAEGDLDQRVTGGFKGVFAELQTGVNDTVARLAQLIGEIAGASASVRKAAEEISHGSADLAARGEQQASSLSETSETMEQMSGSIKSNADHSTSAKALASAAAERAGSGSAIVSRAVEAMGAIEESSTKVTEIVSVIDGIAFQTNLLALNAAVEAARAGDAGKGFAVVASEVRALAQRSSSAAHEIRSLIETSAQQVSAGVNLVTKTGSALDGVFKSIVDVEQAIRSIAEESAEQASGVEEMSLALRQMDTITQQNASIADQSAASATRLSENAESLLQLIAFFKASVNAPSEALRAA